MAIHVDTYFKLWGWTTADKYIPCDVPGFTQYAGDDIMHIDPKGMGGRDSVEYPENYMCATRKLHQDSEGRFKTFLFAANCLKFIFERKGWQWSDKFKQTAFYRNHIEPYLSNQHTLIAHLNEIVQTQNPFKK